jgi:3-oxoacyl-[acyl-carrier protein] reductase
MISFAGKTVLITGAAGAIGARCAELVGGLGARLVLTDASAEALGAARAELPSTVDVVLARVTDVTGAREVEALRGEVARHAHTLDAMILSAGIYRPAPLAAMTDDEWQATLGVNLTGAFHFLRAFAPHMADGGSIVALSSIAQRGSHSFAHYAASKSGLLGLVRSAAIELAPRCRVNAISPGPIDSPMVAPLMERRGAQLIADTPMKRLGTTLDVARAVAFLASDWAGHITGENVHVNGGLYMA